MKSWRNWFDWGLAPALALCFFGALAFDRALGQGAPNATGFGSSGGWQQVGPHVAVTGAPPVPSAGCGSAPAPVILGSDIAGSIISGITGVGSCTMTFAVPFTGRPTCIFETEGAAQSSTFSVTTSAFTFTAAATVRYDWICIAPTGG